VRWGYRCERTDLIPSGDDLTGVHAFKRIGSLLDAFLRSFRKPPDRSTQV
jgi:hypothetical protein